MMETRGVMDEPANAKEDGYLCKNARAGNVRESSPGAPAWGNATGCAAHGEAENMHLGTPWVETKGYVHKGTFRKLARK